MKLMMSLQNYGKNDGTVETGGKALDVAQNEMGGKRC